MRSHTVFCLACSGALWVRIGCLGKGLQLPLSSHCYTALSTSATNRLFQDVSAAWRTGIVMQLALGL
jgi:hypothetical protein